MGRSRITAWLLRVGLLLIGGVMVSLGVSASSAEARVGGITHITDRQELRSCEYATTKAPSRSKRRKYKEGCSRTASVDRQAFGVTATSSFAYENPVYGSSFPDPGPLQNSSTDYYAYSTGGGFPIIKSADMVHWERIGQAFSARPAWVVQSGDWHPWAPSVLRSSVSCPGTTSPGCYFMYYVGLSAQHKPENATDCIGVAWSLTPAGPFTDLGPIQAADGGTDLAGRPPGCGDAGGYGNIDPAPFVDSDGSIYLYLSTSRRCAQPTTATCPYEPVISVLPLASTPTRAKAARKPLFGAAANSWEQQPGYAPQVENPWVEKRGSTYYLFYSGGYYGARYGMGYATASTPTGGSAYSAFAKSTLNPILRETNAVLSPGGGSVTIGPDGGNWLVYHGRAGAYSQPRTLRIDPLFWSGSSVSTPGPTTGPQTAPTVDTTPPETTIDSGPSGRTNSTSAAFSYSSEAGASFECKLDRPANPGAWTSCPASGQSYSDLTTDGDYTFSVRATDQAGNTDATPATRTWTVDRVAPETTITSGPAATTTSTSAVFGFASTEPGGTFECKLDSGVWTSCSSPKSYTNLAAGAHTFSVRATDPAGNVDSTSASRDWRVVSLPSSEAVLLTVTKAGTGSGSVTSSPPGISCGSDCSEQYSEGTAVTVTAMPASGSTFTGWGGSCSGTGPCVVTMDSAHTVTASFAAAPAPAPAPPEGTAGSTPAHALTPAPALASPLPDLTAPRLGISRRTIRTRRGLARVRLSCPASEPGGCRGRLRIVQRVGRRTRTLGSARFSRFASGRSKVVPVRLTHVARRLLRLSSRIRVRVRVRVADDAGNDRTLSGRRSMRRR